MGNSKISEILLVNGKDQYSSNDTIEIHFQFSIEGDIRDSFTEENWTDAYNKNDVSFKLK